MIIGQNRGDKMSKKNNKKNYWQNANLNQYTYYMYRNQILRLAINRYKWRGLPDTCDPEYLEKTLILSGQATIAKTPELGVWVSVGATGGPINLYDQPKSWRAISTNEINFACDPTNAVFIYDSLTQMPSIYPNINIWARRLAEIDQTIDLNLKQQNVPWVFTAPQEQVFDLTNIIKQAMGGEPAILGYKGLGEQYEAKLLASPVELKAEQLMLYKQLLWNDVYTCLGIDNLPKKSERMIEDEVDANNDPTNMLALDGLQARRKAAKEFSKLSGLDVSVVWNADNISKNYNYLNNIQDVVKDIDVKLGGE